MVKIKDFTLASQNLWGHVPPVPYTPGAHASNLEHEHEDQAEHFQLPEEPGALSCDVAEVFIFVRVKVYNWLTTKA